MLNKILATDGDYRQTLALARAIGTDRKVHLGSEKRFSCGFYSRFVQGTMLYSLRSAKDFALSINRYVRSKGIQLFVPVGDICCSYASSEDCGIDTQAVVPEFRTMLIARDKVRMAQRARDVGFRVPRVIDAPCGFPLVVKPISGSGNLRFVNNREELEKAKRYYELRRIPYFVSEYIDGQENYSFCGLFSDGRPIAFFMYREIREYPLTGGSATYAVSTYDAEVKTRCEELLGRLRWNGVAMVEFKIDPSGQLYFMEVNPKFWASLELAIVSGVNFPLLLVRMAEGQKIEQPRYRLGVRFRWLPEDLLGFFSKPSIRFIASFFEKSIVDVHPDDLPPHILRPFTSSRPNKTFRLGYPYGIPMSRSSPTKALA